MIGLIAGWLAGGGDGELDGLTACCWSGEVIGSMAGVWGGREGENGVRWRADCWSDGLDGLVAEGEIDGMDGAMVGLVAGEVAG